MGVAPERGGVVRIGSETVPVRDFKKGALEKEHWHQIVRNFSSKFRQVRDNFVHPSCDARNEIPEFCTFLARNLRRASFANAPSRKF